MLSGAKSHNQQARKKLPSLKRRVWGWLNLTNQINPINPVHTKANQMPSPESGKA